MKLILEFVNGLRSLLDGTPEGSRKLEAWLIGGACCLAFPGSALGIGIATAGYCIGRAIHDHALTTAGE